MTSYWQYWCLETAFVLHIQHQELLQQGKWIHDIYYLSAPLYLLWSSSPSTKEEGPGDIIIPADMTNQIHLLQKCISVKILINPQRMR